VILELSGLLRGWPDLVDGEYVSCMCSGGTQICATRIRSRAVGNRHPDLQVLRREGSCRSDEREKTRAG